MGEPDHFPAELRQNAGCIQARQPYTADQLLRAATEIERLRAVLESLTKDPEPTLDEPDSDAEVIIKMREIARSALPSRSGVAT